MFAWDHNIYHHRLILRELPVEADRVLDVGCGAWALASELAARVRRVDALDRDPTMIGAARDRVPGNVTCILGDVMEHPLDPTSYDAVVSMSSLHHLDLTPALQRFATLLRPGGVLVAVALPRTDLPRELLVEAAGTVHHHIVGAALALSRHRVAPQLAKAADHDAMPIVDPVLSVREIRALAAAVLPGVTVRRLQLWRYLLVWHKPES